jgi:hypothetical protein
MGIEPTLAAPRGHENKQFGQMANPPDSAHRRGHLTLQTTTLFHRIMTVRFDGVAYDSINRRGLAPDAIPSMNGGIHCQRQDWAQSLHCWFPVRTYTKDVFNCD